jgi:hypothetical protein
MKLNSEPINSRSERGERFRRAIRSYRIGFFSVLGILVASELELDLYDQLGSRVRLRLNPDQEVNQSIDCRK